MPNHDLRIPLTYDEAYANARTLLVSAVPAIESNGAGDDDDIRDGYDQAIRRVSGDFYPGEDFDMTWCMRILHSKPGLSEENSRAEGEVSIERYIFDVISIKIRDELAAEFEPIIEASLASGSLTP